MIKKYLIFVLLTLIIAISIQVIGVIKISQIGIDKYDILENERKKNTLNLYFQNEFENLNTLTRAHSYWNEAIQNLNNHNDVWISENLTEYLVFGDYNVTFVYLATEDLLYENAIGVNYSDIEGSEVFRQALEEDLESNSILTIENEMYLVSAFPFATDEQENKQGVYIIGRIIDDDTISDLKILIGQDLHEDHVYVSSNPISHSDFNLTTYIVESIDEDLYINVHLEFQFSTFLGETIKLYLLGISLIVILLIILSIFFMINRFRKELDFTLNQLNNIDLNRSDFILLQHSKSREFNQVIDMINTLGGKVSANIQELLNKNIEVIELLSTASEINDPYTSEHSNNVAKTVVKIAKIMNIKDTSEIELCAKLHDIGKVFIQHNILNKKSALTHEEFEAIKQHPSLGAELLSNLSQFENIRLGVLHHHEKYNGTGYPDKLAGKKIPIFARIVSVADVFDALTSDRPYRSAFTKEKAMEIMLQGRNKLFDPDVLDAFLKITDE